MFVVQLKQIKKLNLDLLYLSKIHISELYYVNKTFKVGRCCKKVEQISPCRAGLDYISPPSPET